MSEEILAALIAAAASVGISVYSLIVGQRSARELESLKSTLTERQAERDARRAYEYNALQRLYEEYEPLRFQLHEAVESAKAHIEDLGTQRRILLQGIAGVYPGKEYILRTTIYHLLLPSAVFRIISRRLTLIDLRLDPHINLQYLLAKKATLALADDVRLARLLNLDYTPYVEGWREKRLTNPEKYRRQALPRGRLDNALDALIVAQADNSRRERVVSFGEFETKLEALEEGDVRSALGAARDLFADFEPERRPVLWRLILIQSSLIHDGQHIARRRYFVAAHAHAPVEWPFLKHRAPTPA